VVVGWWQGLVAGRPPVAVDGGPAAVLRQVTAADLEFSGDWRWCSGDGAPADRGSWAVLQQHLY
jgi:hypothetical protein